MDYQHNQHKSSFFRKFLSFNKGGDFSQKSVNRNLCRKFPTYADMVIKIAETLTVLGTHHTAAIKTYADNSGGYADNLEDFADNHPFTHRPKPLRF